MKRPWFDRGECSLILFGSLSHHCTLTLAFSYADLFLIHNFINYISTYTAYFSVNDPCSFGGSDRFDAMSCRQELLWYQLNYFRCTHQIDSLQQWRFLLFTILNILNVFIEATSLCRDDFVTKRLNFGFSEILELKPDQDKALLHFVKRESCHLNTANLWYFNFVRKVCSYLYDRGSVMQKLPR